MARQDADSPTAADHLGLAARAYATSDGLPDGTTDEPGSAPERSALSPSGPGSSSPKPTNGKKAK